MAKKRRLGSDPDGEDAFMRSLQHGPGHKIEEELATALGGNHVVDTMEPTDHTEAGPSVPPEDSNSSINPDVASLISDIMDHTERQEETVALGPQEIPPEGDFPGAKGFAFLRANSNLKIQSLPILDNLVRLARASLGMGTNCALVYANPFVPFQALLPRPNGHGVGTGLGQRPSLRNHALSVRSHQESLHCQGILPSFVRS